jgi:hypothetical protein
VDEVAEEGAAGGEVMSEPNLGLLRPSQEDDQPPQRVSYSDLGQEQKGQVLADLLVKSALSQALDTRNQVQRTLEFFPCFSEFFIEQTCLDSTPASI